MRLYVHDRLAGYPDETCWTIAMLVACSVDPTVTGEQVSPVGKVAVDRFIGDRRMTASVLLHGLAAWEAAADDGLVPHAADLLPTDNEHTALPTARWRDYYSPVGMMIEILDREEN